MCSYCNLWSVNHTDNIQFGGNIMFLNKFFGQKGKFPLLLIVLLLILSGCVYGNNQENPQAKDNPTPKEFFENGDADIFVIGDIVYSNVQDVDWVTKLNYTLGKQIGPLC